MNCESETQALISAGCILSFASSTAVQNLVVHDGNSADIVFGYSDALVFEPQLFPDVSNHTNFPSAHLDPGGTYENTMVYRFSVLKH